eukprot:scaffold71848_cov63-Phaeocystis_antarctica.AAC.4
MERSVTHGASLMLTMVTWSPWSSRTATASAADALQGARHVAVGGHAPLLARHVGLDEAGPAEVLVRWQRDAVVDGQHAAAADRDVFVLLLRVEDVWWQVGSEDLLVHVAASVAVTLLESGPLRSLRGASMRGALLRKALVPEALLRGDRSVVPTLLGAGVVDGRAGVLPEDVSDLGPVDLLGEKPVGQQLLQVL